MTIALTKIAVVGYNAVTPNPYPTGTPSCKAWAVGAAIKLLPLPAPYNCDMADGDKVRCNGILWQWATGDIVTRIG